MPINFLAFSQTNCLAACLIAASSLTALAATPDTPVATPNDRVHVAENYGKLPLSFEANRGQTDKSVRFLSRGKGYSLYLTDSAAVLSLTKPSSHACSHLASPGCALSTNAASRVLKGDGFSHRDTARKTSEETIAAKQTADIVRMELVGANGTLQVTGKDQLSGTANYFMGNDPSQWHTNVPTYAKVEYKSVYPGVDLVYYGNQQQLEYDFVVAPGVDPKQIKLHFAGADKLKLASNGDLQILATDGEIAFQKPILYQTKDGQRQPIEGRFKLLAHNDVAFAIGNYDRSQALVIDPTLAYSTYLGGSDNGLCSGPCGDAAAAIAVDGSGNVYVTGVANSSDFPLTSNPIQGCCGGGAVFVTKINPLGTSLIYSTYLGGIGSQDSGYAIATDSAGNAYITGSTSSLHFPVTSNAFQTVNNGGGGNSNAFVTKINPDGSALIYSSYLGGSGNYYGDIGYAIAIDSAGNAYLTGFTYSQDFPISSNAFQKTNYDSFAGYSSAFVTKVNAAGTALLYSTYLGGTGNNFGGDGGAGIAVDDSGNAYVTGTAVSTDFPVTGGAFQTSGANSPFVTKINPTGSALIYSTYLGTGSGNGIAVDTSGEAFITGSTGDFGFPVTSDAFQKAYNSPNNLQSNGFVTKMNSTGTGLIYSTYLGGSGTSSGGDSASGIAIDANGNAYVTGSASSTDFPLTGNALQSVNNASGNNATNPFATELNPSGSGLVYSTYLGGSTGDSASGIAIDSAGNIYIAGTTYSTNFPVSSSAFQKTNNEAKNSENNAFIAKIALGSTSIIHTTTTLKSSANPQTFGLPVTFTASVAAETGSATPNGSVVFSIDGSTAATITLSGGEAQYSTSSLTVGTHTIIASYGGNLTFAASTSATLNQVINAASEPQAATPVFSPAAGTYSTPQSVTITDATAGAVIYFTTNGSTPTISSTKYTAPIVVSATTTIKAIAVATGYTNSIVASATYTITTPKPAATPAISPAAGTYLTAKTITVSDTTSGAAIYYTLDGSTPTTSSTKYTAAFKIAATTTVKAIAAATGYSNSAVASSTFTITPVVATPVIAPAAGTYTTTKTISITDTTAGASIYYTVNGTTPTTSSTKYTAAFKIAATTTVKAIAAASGYINSSVASTTYTINLPKPAATPVIAPAAGSYATIKTITITDATSGAIIYYTLNGSTPTTSSTKYTAAFKIDASATVKAIAVAAGYTTSAVASSTYTITLPTATPTISPAAGTYTTAKTITMADTTSGATIHYTLDGSTPTASSTQYTAAFKITATTTVKAIAVASGHTSSAVATSTYTIN